MKESELIERINEQIKNRPVVNGYTIDGPTSKDLDDGLFLSESGDNYLLEISIADVSSVVTPESELFTAAYERIETEYLADSNIPMIPRIFSENKLSLMPGDLRPAITFFLEITPDGTVINLEIKETAFNNLKKLSYSKFDRILKDKADPRNELFSKMFNLAEFLLQTRRQKGALAIYDLKRGIYTNEEGALMPLKKESYCGHLVIQEFAIITNKAVAWFFAKNDIPILFRNHTIKQNAPDRNEILSQVNTSISHPELLTSFFNRFTLWCNRADYGPVVKGHFALNEPVYTHVTSPIRRIADLINHFVIKSYIRNTVSPVSFTDLVEMSEDINKRILLKKTEKKEYYKERVDKISMSVLREVSESNLEQLKDGDFINVVRTAAKNDILSDKLNIEILNRLNSENFNIKILYIILFKTVEDSSNWFELKQEILSYIYREKSLAVQLLYVLEQKEIFRNLVINTQERNSYFLSTIKGDFRGKELECVNHTAAIRKKDSIQDAAFAFLEKLTGISIEKKDKIAEESELNNNSFKEKDNINHVGRLMEICSQSKKLSMPQFEFTVEGASHSPTFTCYGSIVTPEFIIKSEAKSGNKKESKQGAAEKLLYSIKEKNLDFDKIETKSSEPSNDNYIGSLMEFCAKNQLPAPEYKYRVTGEQQMQTLAFECYVTINIANDIQEFMGYADRKKQAKQIASKNCLDYLNKFFNIKE